MTKALHHLSISLEQVKPRVQREFVVPSSLRLDHLHTVIQVVMGWTDTHMHEFIVGTLRDGIRYGRPDPEFANIGFGPQTRKETGAILAQIAPAKGNTFRYWYDFGDDWMHVLKVKAIVPVEVVGNDIPFCIKGRGACSPEDCGGLWGYANLLATLADPVHEDHADMLEWIGGPFRSALLRRRCHQRPSGRNRRRLAACVGPEQRSNEVGQASEVRQVHRRIEVGAPTAILVGIGQRGADQRCTRQVEEMIRLSA